MVAEFDSVALAGAVSNVLGILYFMAWSLSFYPQVLLNHKRRSTEGAAIDFSVANTLGFASYTVYTAVCLWSPTVRAQYAYRHPEAPEQTVRLNDLAFAAHGTVLCIVLYSQYWPAVWGFNVGARQKASRAVLGIMCGSLLGTMAVLSAVWLCGRNGGSDPSGWCWIDVMYALSAIKLIITVYKYTPQVRTNYLQQSTHGWSIWQILLDLTGGVLSFAQLLTDSALQRNWSGITGNPIKVGLAGTVICHHSLTRHITGMIETEAQKIVYVIRCQGGETDDMYYFHDESSACMERLPWTINPTLVVLLTLILRAVETRAHASLHWVREERRQLCCTRTMRDVR